MHIYSVYFKIRQNTQEKFPTALCCNTCHCLFCLMLNIDFFLYYLHWTYSNKVDIRLDKETVKIYVSIFPLRIFPGKKWRSLLICISKQLSWSINGSSKRCEWKILWSHHLHFGVQRKVRQFHWELPVGKLMKIAKASLRYPRAINSHKISRRCQSFPKKTSTLNLMMQKRTFREGFPILFNVSTMKILLIVVCRKLCNCSLVIIECRAT